MAWHRRAWAGIAIRTVGVALLGCTAVSAMVLFRHYGPASPATPLAVAYPLALVAFAAASAGSVLLVLGAHIFDEVEVSDRWARRCFAVGPEAERPHPDPRNGEPVGRKTRVPA